MSDPSWTAVKTLFAHSRNLCFFTRCEERLTDPAWKQVNGEVAHIKGERKGSARFDPDQSEADRQGYENLMLLCPKDHKRIDRLEPDTYDVDTLVEMRAAHLIHAADEVWCSDEEAEAFALLAIQQYRERHSRGLRVLNAEYGERDTFVDVTELVAGAVAQDRLELPVSNESMGGDPLVNVVKRLAISYEFNGEPLAKSFMEGEIADLP